MSDSSLSTLPRESVARFSQHGFACLDWRLITALGLPEAEAKAVVQTLSFRQLTRRYHWRLGQVGIPQEAVGLISEAIAYYDTYENAPAGDYQSLMTRYCVEICRAGLWRAQLLDCAA